MKRISMWLFANEMRSKISLIVLLACFSLPFIFLMEQGSYFMFAPYTLLYLAFAVLINMFEKNRLMKPIVYIVNIPLAILLIVAPYFRSLGVYIIVLCSCFGLLVLCISIFTKYVLETESSFAPIAYLSLTGITILFTLIGDKIVKGWYYLTYDKSYESSQKILDQKRFKFLIYAVYFILLIVARVLKLNGMALFNDENAELALLESLGTFMAFDSMLSNKGLLTSKDKAPN